MTVRQLMLHLSRFDGQLEVMVTTNRPAAILEIETVTEGDPDKESYLVMLECDGPDPN